MQEQISSNIQMTRWRVEKIKQMCECFRLSGAKRREHGRTGSENKRENVQIFVPLLHQYTP